MTANEKWLIFTLNLKCYVETHVSLIFTIPEP